MYKYLLILFIVFMLFSSCGNDDSSESLIRPETEESSSSSKLMSSSLNSSSSNEKKSSSSVESSSSMETSSSSEDSSSSEKKLSSSVGSSSNMDTSSSSEDSSSSEKKSSSSVESSSSMDSSSSSERSSSSSNSVYDAANNTLTDLRDNHVYKTVTIGTQIWMAQNIDYLPEDTVGTKYGGRTICGGGESGTAIEGDCFVYGRLYERTVLIDSLGNGQVICPDGWIIPSSEDWDVLIDYLGGESVAGKKMKLNDASMWGENMEHLNESGFSATMTGYFYFVRPQFNDTSDKNKRTSMLIYPVEIKSIIVRTKTIYDDKDLIKDGNYIENYGISVRCIKNSK